MIAGSSEKQQKKIHSEIMNYIFSKKPLVVITQHILNFLSFNFTLNFGEGSEGCKKHL